MVTSYWEGEASAPLYFVPKWNSGFPWVPAFAPEISLLTSKEIYVTHLKRVAKWVRLLPTQRRTRRSFQARSRPIRESRARDSMW
jgi:hypothetical protein